jgi:signal transduction histidine kinase/ActR/RegA family two-component response regulator
LFRFWQSPPRRIQSALICLVVACIVPAWAADTFLIFSSYQRERADVERDTAATARALAQAVDRELTGAQAALAMLATSPSLRKADLAAFYTQAQEGIENFPGNNIVLLGRDGNQLINTFRPFGAPLPQSGDPPELFQPFETGKPFISDVFQGAVTKTPVVAVVLPVVDDGRVIYVLAMGIFPDRLASILRPQDIPPGWASAIFDNTGTIVARAHRAEEFVGRKGTPELVRRIAEGGEGVFDNTTLEGIPVLTSFSRSAMSGWTVAIGIPKAEALGPLRRSLWLSAAGSAILLLACGALAQFISRRIAGSIEALATVAHALGDDKAIAVPPLAIKEADEVGRAMARASEMLRQRAAERDEAEHVERRLLVEKRAAEQASRAKSEFLALVSHEIRTPMTTILGMSELLIDSSLTWLQRGHATLLHEAGELLLKIIDDLLDIAKIEAGTFEPEHVPLSPKAVAEAALAITRPLAAKRALELRNEIAPDVPAWVEGDPTRLEQILLNLLSNAVKFTKRGSVGLKVTAEAGAGRLRFEVRDTGIGIAAAQQDLLFRRFFQLGQAGDRPRGSGLGLAISRQLVEVMGGRIGVESRVGEGSIFWFSLPCRETRPPAPEPGETAPEAGSRTRVLLAEDNEQIRRLVETVLTEAGHEVVLAENGAEAIAAIERRKVDLVLMDVQMPEMDGLTATQRIRQLDAPLRYVPIILFTAHATNEEVAAFRVAGATDYLTKPIKRQELLRAIAHWTDSVSTTPWSKQGRDIGP